MRSLTIEDTILPKAPPMITPTAMSTALPFMANCLNSFISLPMRFSAILYYVMTFTAKIKYFMANLSSGA